MATTTNYDTFNISASKLEGHLPFQSAMSIQDTNKFQLFQRKDKLLKQA